MGIRSVPRTIWALGLVSMFMDISSEMINSLLPVYLVASLGASPALVGIIEGVAEATASIAKFFSGWLSDRLGRRKLLTVLGYGLSAITKPIFPLAGTPYEVLVARFLDRIGKGIRDAPRDALVADVTPENLRGAGFGLRQALDSGGAFLGPLAAIGFMWAFDNNMRAVFGLAIVPAAIAVVVLIVGVKEPTQKKQLPNAKSPLSWAEAKEIGAPFWVAVAVGVMFTLARFSEAFLVLRGSNAGIPLALVPVVMIVMNVVYSLVSAPAGSLSDTFGRKVLLTSGIVILVIADLVLALVGSVTGVLLGVALWGLHLGLTQGLLAALVADTAPPRLRGTGFGLFNLATGATTLLASVVAGAVWSARGATVTFLVGGGFAVVALLGVILLLKEKPIQAVAPG
jgi:MFS family permease